MKKGYKKTRTWLKKLPDGYRERALSQIDEDSPYWEKSTPGFRQALQSFCDWYRSVEGFDFWDKVDGRYLGYNKLPPLPEPEIPPAPPHYTPEEPPITTGSIEATLEERGSRYGEWKDNAELIEELHITLARCTNYESTPAYVKQAFKMICTKMVRCLNGDWKHLDTFTDIDGFNELAHKEVLKELNET